jgi:outer membrane lipoprotein carrier protein
MRTDSGGGGGVGGGGWGGGNGRFGGVQTVPMKRATIVLALLAGTTLACGGDAGDGRRAVPADTMAPVAVLDSPGPAPSVRVERARVDTSSRGVARSEPPASAMPDAAASPEPPEAQDSALALLQRTARLYASLGSMRATFSMETSNPLLREAVKSRGELAQRRPDRLLMRFTEPAGDVIVSDGQYIWVWYPSLDSTQVMRSPAGSGGGAVDLLAQFVGDPTRRFSWSVGRTETIDGHAATMYTLDPLGDEAYRQLVVWIDRDDALVRRFEVTELSGVERSVDLRDLSLDPDLPDSLFRFTPPPGVSIVGSS